MKRYVISSWYEPDEPPYDIENYEIELYFEDTLVTVEADGTTKIDYDFTVSDNIFPRKYTFVQQTASDANSKFRSRLQWVLKSVTQNPGAYLEI